MENSLIEIKNLETVYALHDSTVRAVNNISFQLNKGETLGIVGETGAGKTTTALSIMRLLPDRVGKIKNGQIIFNGEDLLLAPERSMTKIRGDKIAMIFQDPMSALNPIETIGDQISESLELHNSEANRSKKEIELRVDEVLNLVGISSSRKNDYPHQFSGGMKQRVVIAMALVCEPELLIADEPTTALDVTIQAQVLEMMRDLRERFNMAMIMISHDLGVIAKTCDKVAVMYAGSIIEQGTIYDIFDSEKRHPYTEGLFGSIPNINDDSDRLSPIPGLMPDPTDLPDGCPFSPRCPYVMDICKREFPPNYSKGSHGISCFLFKEDKDV